MKRFLPLLLIVTILTGLLLSREARVPGRFTGTWYEAGTGEAYLFEEGIIRKDDRFRGAYSFTRDTVTLFVSGVEELETVQKLRWKAGKEGDILRRESGDICFRRKP